MDYDRDIRSYVPRKISSASANAALFGLPKMFIPRWLELEIDNKNKEGIFDPRTWTYLYDHLPLAKTLDRYIDYKKLNLAANEVEEQKPEVLRLIITAVDVLTAKPLVFDNTRMEIKAKHILASAAYPIYGFHWIEVENGVYAWDGSLLSNTPVREVIYSSPRNDKNIIIVENYPQKIDRLPSNLAEVESRARDILFCDKDMDDIRMSRFITRQIKLIRRLYQVFEKFGPQSGLSENEIAKIKSEYSKLIHNYGAQILSVIRIIRSEIESPQVFKNANFSPRAVQELIIQGETKAAEKLDKLSKGTAFFYEE
jgi:NTE family protein